MKILIDFDGTCVEHDFPRVGKNIGAIPVLKALVEKGHQLILFTMRSNLEKVNTGGNPELLNEPKNYLQDAVEWFHLNGIHLHGIQKDPGQENWTNSPKAYGHMIIDDTALGVPLTYEKGKRPYVNWVKVEQLLKVKKVL